MFDFAWSEIVLIGAVALIAIGPKDMPAAIRTVSSMVKKARRMASEFQTHVDEMVREADLGEVKKTFSDLRNMNIPDMLEKHVDPDRSLRNTFNEDPFKPSYPAASEVSTLDEVAVGAQPAAEALALDEAPSADSVEAAPPVPPEPEAPLYPSFIPPGFVPQPVKDPTSAAAPAFVPPEAVRQRLSKA